MTEPVNTALSHSVEDVQLASPLVEFFIGHEIKPEHLLDGLEGAGLKAMDAGGGVLLRMQTIEIKSDQSAQTNQINQTTELFLYLKSYKKILVSLNLNINMILCYTQLHHPVLHA